MTALFATAAPLVVFFCVSPAWGGTAAGDWVDYTNEAQKHIIVIKGRGEPMRPIVRRRLKADGDWEYKVDLKSFPKPTATPTPSPSQAIEPCKLQSKPRDEYAKYIDNIINAIGRKGNEKLLFFIHGGMNYPAGAAAHAAYLLGKNQPKSSFDLSSKGYPIFICWQSPPTGYLEQVTWVRAGRSERYGESVSHKFYAFATLPFHVLADFGRGFTRFPAELSEFVHNDLYSIYPYPFSEFRTLTRETDYLNKCPQSHVHVSSAPKAPKTAARYFENLQTVVIFPFRTLSLPVLDSVGVGAWENMLRHTDTMFDRTDAGSSKHPTPVEEAVERDQTGALAIFFKQLQSDPHLNKFPITLVGHSMGAIISNRLVSSYPDLKYSNIVYMGAACSVRDFEASVIPYMTKNTGTHFYNLSLHPQCEAGEVALSPKNLKLDVAPRGSLLVWIDNIFGHPPSEDQRRFGIFQTAVLASHNFSPDVRDRITLKCFDFGGKEPQPGLIWHPQHHGDFTSSPFWNSDFWNLKGKPPSSATVALTAR